MHIFRKTNNIIPNWVHKMVITWLVINIFYETYTIGFSTHRAINPCQKLNFYKISRVVPFLIAGRILALYYHYYAMHTFSPSLHEPLPPPQTQLKVCTILLNTPGIFKLDLPLACTILRTIILCYEWVATHNISYCLSPLLYNHLPRINSV